MKNKRNKPSHAEEDRKRNDALNKSENRSLHKLPGDYPPQEDIMIKKNMQRIGMDMGNFSRNLGTENINKNEPVISEPNDIQDAPPATPSGDFEDRTDNIPMEHPIPRDMKRDEEITDFESDEGDVTEEDLEALGPKDLSMDMGEDERMLKNRTWPVDMAGKDLDVPGSEGAGDTGDEAIGPEDEENDFYSLGGDRHEDNLEGK
jgi:hypothetical protein